MKKKMKEVSKYWNQQSDDWKEYMNSEDFFNFEDFDSLRRFDGTHPAVFGKRIQQQNWNVQFDLRKKHFSTKDRLLYWFEKKTGIRPFDFKNYKIIK